MTTAVRPERLAQLGFVSMPSGGDMWRAVPMAVPSGAQMWVIILEAKGGFVVQFVFAVTGLLSGSYPTSPAARFLPHHSLTAREQLDTIQNALAIPITALAEILGVTRPTVYRWVDADTLVPRDSEAAERLRILSRVAEEWRVRSATPLGRFARLRLEDGRSLLDWVAEPKPHMATICGVLDVLARYVHDRAVTPSRSPSSLPASPEAIADDRERLRALVRRSRHLGR